MNYTVSAQSLAQLIIDSYPCVAVLYDEAPLVLQPVSRGWFGRLVAALLGKPTHTLEPLPGYCAFTIITSKPVSTVDRKRLACIVDFHRPVGVTIELRYQQAAAVEVEQVTRGVF